MITIKNKKHCCGCEACAQKCPSKCIEIFEDEEGFSYPKVNSEYCIACNICEKVCPMIVDYNVGNKISSSYISYNLDLEERLKSSSGGIFLVIAKEILSKNGVVYSAIFLEDFTVEHSRITNVRELNKARGSKYLQSKIGCSYKNVEKDLKENKYVLFVGTSCQIAGLQAYLNTSYDKLFTIDIVCHGVPSRKVWKKYLAELEYQFNEKVTKVNFRDKSNGWNNYNMKITFETQEYVCNHLEDPYMRFFLSDIDLRPSCYECKFKGLNRASDLTLGDAWGIENYCKAEYDDNGVSIILVNTPKGHEILNNVSENIHLEKYDIDIIFPKYSGGRRNANFNPNREKFFRKINTNRIEDLLSLIEFSFIDRIKIFLNKLNNKVKR